MPDASEHWSSNPKKGLNSAENAAEHAADHADEFGMTKAEYIDATKRFVSKPPSTAEVFVRENGETMIYDPPTNTFAVRTPEGPPATMYQPTDGLQYWVDQLREWGGERAAGTR